jgi:hypothetical protein
MWNNAAGLLFYSEHFANYKTSEQLTEALFIPLCPPSCLPFVHSLFLSFTALPTPWYGMIYNSIGDQILRKVTIFMDS